MALITRQHESSDARRAEGVHSPWLFYINAQSKAPNAVISGDAGVLRVDNRAGTECTVPAFLWFSAVGVQNRRDRTRLQGAWQAHWRLRAIQACKAWPVFSSGWCL